MKRLWIYALMVVGALATQSHAIFGIGGQWAPALGFDVKASQDTVTPSSATRPIVFDENGLSGLQGFGAKIWIDALPFVDLQMSGNMQFGYYDADFILPGGDTTALNYKLKLPLLQGKPFFARMYGDLAVLYPFLKLPPLVSMVKVYGGGGLTYGVATQILSASLAKQTITNAYHSGALSDNSTAAQIAPVLTNAILKEGLKTGMGGFIQLGSQFKVPVIPIAIFLDFKYHFMGFAPELTSGSGLTMELGGALAF